MKQRSYAIGIIVFACIIAGAVYVMRNAKSDKSDSMSSVDAAPLIDQQMVNDLPKKSGSSVNTSHLANGLVPPTNSWLSGMVLQQSPFAVYPLPLSFLAHENGFEIGLPSVTSTTTEIAGEHTPGMTVSFDANSFQLTRYDKASATLTYNNNQQSVGTVTLSEGSPFVFYNADQQGIITLSGINPTNILEHDRDYIRYNKNGHTYALSSKQATVSVNAGNVAVDAQKGDEVTFYALPGNQDVLRQYASNALKEVQVSHNVAGKSVQTTLHYVTDNDGPTAFAVLPYQSIGGQQVGSYQSIYGPMKLLVGRTLATTVPAMSASGELDVSHFTAAQKASLASSLTSDAASTAISETDAYSAGKQLARAANLLSIAEQLHQTESADKLKSVLNQAFAQRLSTSNFYYDTTIKGVAYATPSFGSQDFNDHHYHYGYWLYAASILGKYDPSFVNSYKNQLNLLAADIASYQDGTAFPLERTYDPYVGHSWAAGLAPFADGNDQESSSEAVHAWNGVSLWGQVTNNNDLEQTGLWMLANESNAASSIWRSVDTSDNALKSYTSPVVGITFGGKRVYATWFSGDSSAMLGIQLIPMDPSMTSFASDKNIQSRINATIQNDNYNVSLGDYILMYLSLVNPQKAESLAQNQTNIDSGNSKTYLEAFIYSQLDR